jgi:hypothetical protein
MKRVLKIVGVVVLGLGALIAIAVAYAGQTANRRLQFPGTPLPPVKASQDPAVIEQVATWCTRLRAGR